MVSIPPDVQVPIPGHGDGKIGSAYSDGGSALTIQTVEQLTNMRVDHFAMIDWAGFRVRPTCAGYSSSFAGPGTLANPVSASLAMRALTGAVSTLSVGAMLHLAFSLHGFGASAP